MQVDLIQDHAVFSITPPAIHIYPTFDNFFGPLIIICRFMSSAERIYHRSSEHCRPNIVKQLTSYFRFTDGALGGGYHPLGSQLVEMI